MSSTRQGMGIEELYKASALKELEQTLFSLKTVNIMLNEDVLRQNSVLLHCIPSFRLNSFSPVSQM